MGLRAKFNLVVVPVVVAVAALVVWADYRHETTAIMEAHAIHAGPVGAPSTGPVDPTTLPEAVAGASLRAHAVYGLLLVGLVVIAVNTALQAFIFRPLEQLRGRLARLELGYWRDATAPTSDDELGRFQQTFDGLGLEIAAVVGQALDAERLAAVALVSRQLSGQLEPEIRRIAEVAARLTTNGDPVAQQAGTAVAKSAATILAAVRALDRVFPPELRARRSGARLVTKAEGVVG